MSDLNDDLLNYELGEELDEQSLLVADEDDLLLSDEELDKNKAVLKDEAEKWVINKLKETEEEPQNNSNISIKEPEVSTSSSCQKQQQCNDRPENSHSTVKHNSNSESDVSTSGESPVKNNQPRKHKQFNKNTDEKKIDEVTSTNKEIELDSGLAQPQHSIVKNDGIISSQEGTNKENTDQDPSEDCDEQHQRGERMNIKHANERDDNAESSPEKYIHGNNRYMHSKRGGRGGMRGIHYPGQRSSLPVPHNQFPPPHQYHPMEHQGVNNSMAIRPQFHPQSNLMNGARMEFRPNFRPQIPNDYNNGVMLNLRGPRSDFQSPNGAGGPYNNFPHQNNMRPIFRPDMSHMRPRMPIRPSSVGMQPIHGNLNSNYLINSGGPPIQHQSHTIGGNGNLSGHGGNISSGTGVASVSVTGSSSTTVLLRKVLINPNFKGGVEAATNQLMKDTQFMQTINSHVPHLQSDEELLRQQEEFINKNRIHIQKRYARSPDRNRERSYSPPVRKDRYFDNRENRRGLGGSRGRGRRACSREPDVKFVKRRRSSSPGRKRDNNRIEEPEDEETRAYRLEIEKQKAMREKILRDKEMRRRRAAEGKTQLDDTLPFTNDQAPAKLKPIIVTESKIISLKKNKETEKIANATNASETLQPFSQQLFTLKRTLPTAKILGETKRNIYEHFKKETATNINCPEGTTFVTVPVVKNKTTAPVQTDLATDNVLEDYEENDEADELLEEERLLADTPSPAYSANYDEDDGEPHPKKPTKSFMSSNRKVVLKSSKKNSDELKKKKNFNLRSKTVDNKERVFDRLEKKKIGVNENDKRRIQRIFINNFE